MIGGGIKSIKSVNTQGKNAIFPVVEAGLVTFAFSYHDW